MIVAAIEREKESIRRSASTRWRECCSKFWTGLMLALWKWERN